MQAQQNQPNNSKEGGFSVYFLKRLIVAILFIGVVLWAIATGVDYFEKPGSWQDRLQASQSSTSQTQNRPSAGTAGNAHTAAGQMLTPSRPASGENHGGTSVPNPSIANNKKIPAQPEQPHGAQPHEATDHGAIKDVPKEAAHESSKVIAVPKQGEQHPSTISPHGMATQPSAEVRPVGVAFVEAVVQPMKFELEDRFWGWRPNDIIDLTDNINEFQIGTLEVTRRTVVQLTERISRTGYNDAFDRNLENAMNSLMVKADSYWFPSPESKYKESLAELEKYKQKLLAGKANFYTRPDNLIPLFTAYEEILGSCDENLVKSKEPDGSKVGFTEADNYFYYAKGVANAMAIILEAAQRDFATTLELRHGGEFLHHAILSCQLAASLDPWITTNGALDGILANHRAHMAAPISHARYYMGQLIKTLST